MADSIPVLSDVEAFTESHLLREVLEAIPHHLAVLDGEGRVLATTHPPDVLSADPVLTCHLHDHLLKSLRETAGDQGAIAEHIADGLERILKGRAGRFELQYETAESDGSRWSLVTVAALPSGGAVITHTDTSSHNGAQDVLEEMAFHDALTGLPNRSLVIDRIRMALIRAQRGELVPAVLFLDLDGFKSINDSYGHAVGDAVLIEVSRRLSASIREEDTCGRWGGDEFVLVIELADTEVVDRLIQRARAAFEQPVKVGDVRLRVSLSVGVVVSSVNDDVGQLIRAADSAMYEAKRAGETTRSDVLYLP